MFPILLKNLFFPPMAERMELNLLYIRNVINQTLEPKNNGSDTNKAFFN